MTWGTHFHRAGVARPMCSILAADQAYELHMRTASDQLLRAVRRELIASHERRFRQL